MLNPMGILLCKTLHNSTSEHNLSIHWKKTSRRILSRDSEDNVNSGHIWNSRGAPYKFPFYRKCNVTLTS